MYDLKKKGKTKSKDIIYVIFLILLMLQTQWARWATCMGDILLGEGKGFTIYLPKHGNHVVMGCVQEYLFLSLVALNREAICPYF